jgi:hypothetical protein
MKMSGYAPLLTTDDGTRYVGLKHPDGSESVLMFAGDVDFPPAGSPGEPGVLQWAISSDDTDVPLAPPVPAVAVGSTFKLDAEYMTVTDISNADNPKVTRGGRGSAPAAHAQGAAITIWPPPGARK